MTELAAIPAPYVPKDWKEKRNRRLMVLSATQFDVFELCPRKWWLKFVRGLPEPDSKSTIFGTVLHSVVERFLSGGRQGRNPDGTPIDLYPPGWTKAFNRYDKNKVDGEVTPAEADIIRRLMTSAIEQGVIECWDNGSIEHPFQVTLIKLPCWKCQGDGKRLCTTCGGQGQWPIDATSAVTCQDCGGLRESKCDACGGDGKGDHIQVKGFIDYLLADGVQDHKTTGNVRYWKSKEALRENPQMLIYAKVLMLLIEQTSAEIVAEGGNALPIPGHISLRHNQFCSDPNEPRVRKTEIFVTPMEIEDNWRRLSIIAQKMSTMRRNINYWHEAPDPAQKSNACNAFGGCKFMNICGGRQSETDYEKLFVKKSEKSDKSVDEPVTPPLKLTTVAERLAMLPGGNSFPSTNSGDPSMGIRDAIARQGAATNQAAAMPPGGAINPPPSAPVPQAAMQQAVMPQAPQAVMQPTQQPAVALQPIAQVQQPAAQSPSPVGSMVPVGNGVEPSPIVNAVPWATNCMACSGLGLNTAGTACVACDTRRKNAGLPNSYNYKYEPVGNGQMYWKGADGSEGVAPLRLDVAQVRADTRVELPQQPAAPAAAPASTGVVGMATPQAPAPPAAMQAGAPVVGGHPIQPPTPSAPAVGDTKKRTRRTKAQIAADEAAAAAGGVAQAPAAGSSATNGEPGGYVIVKGGMLTRGSVGDHVTIDELFKHYTDEIIGQKIAEKAAPEGSTYWDLDTWKRKEYLQSIGQHIAADIRSEFGDVFIFIDTLNPMPDVRAFIDAILPYAAGVINAIAV